MRVRNTGSTSEPSSGSYGQCFADVARLGVQPDQEFARQCDADHFVWLALRFSVS